MRSRKDKSAFSNSDAPLTAEEMFSETLKESDEKMPASTSTEDEIDKMVRQKRRKVIFYSSLSAVAVIGVVISAVLLNPLNHTGSLSSKGLPSSTTPVLSGQATVPTDDVNAGQNFAKENPIPFSHDKWQENPYNTQVVGKDKNTQQPSEDLRKNILASVEQGSIGGGLYSDSLNLPSESAGFTSDFSKVKLDDGTLNPMFSYWTAERFQVEVGSMVERLLNPIYGGWENYQYPEYKANSEFDTSLISDLFTSNWSDSNTGKPYHDYVPVFADWGSDNYGGAYDLTDVSRWFGQITSSTTTFTYDETKLQYTAVYEARVKFTAWTKDQGKVEKMGTLTLNLVPGSVDGGYENSSSNRVLIDSGSLRMDD